MKNALKLLNKKIRYFNCQNNKKKLGIFTDGQIKKINAKK